MIGGMTSSATAGASRGPGRLREETTEQAITLAARQVLAEKGLSRMSMETVAARAGVAKSTLYRRWPSKVEPAVHAVAVSLRHRRHHGQGLPRRRHALRHRAGRPAAA